MDVPIWAWAAVAGFVVIATLVDVLIFGRKPHAITIREASIWSIAWLTLGFGFAGIMWWWAGPQMGGEYLAGYVIEKSLSIDNIFVFAMIFTYFNVPIIYRQRVLLWGVIGALVLRAALIFIGAALLAASDIVLYVFGVILIVTGIKMARSSGHKVDPSKNPVLKFVKRFVRSTDEYHGHRIFTRINGKRLATPLFAVFVVVASTDLLFALDSIPAIFAVTEEPFIVLTANVFALLGLRALYFLLDGAMARFVHVQPALAAILVFVGAKMLVHDWYHPPIWLSLVVIVSILTLGVLASNISAKRIDKTAEEAGDDDDDDRWRPAGRLG